MQTTLRRIAGPAFAALVAALVLTPAALYAQAPQVERIDIFDAGIYCAETIQRVPDASAPGGYRNVVTNITLLKRTNKVPAQLGTRFGMRYTIVGTPNGERVDIRLVTRLPSPGLRDPEMRKTILVNEYTFGIHIGADGYREYHLEHDWEMVPGVWIFELWESDRKLAEQRFMLAKPQPAQKRNSIPCAPVVSSLTTPMTAQGK